MLSFFLLISAEDEAQQSQSSVLAHLTLSLTSSQLFFHLPEWPDMLHGPAHCVFEPVEFSHEVMRSPLTLILV